jgi:DNA-directed RNA polymerase I subunit RPA49
MMQLRNDLGQTFGTKKARKAITSLTENAISPNKSARQTSPGGSQRTKMDSVTTAMLESIAEVTSNMATREELSAAVDNAKPRPIANLAAESINDVYTIESLIGSEIIKQIPVKEWRDAVKAGKEVITKSKFVAHRLQKVATSDVQKLRALRYLLCLLEFFGSARPKGKGIRVLPYKDGLRAAVTGVPEAVLEHIRRKFSVNGQMLKYQTDLLITHACALALVVDNFEVDMYDLREDLHLEVKEISQYFQEIGAKVMAANEVERKRLSLDKAAAVQRKFARLRLPLEFPKLKFARRR